MKIAKITLILVLPLITTFYVQAQTKYDKKLEKADEYYDHGDYSKARSEIETIKKSSTKKLGEKNDFIPIAKIREAQYDVALGILDNVHTSVQEGLSLSRELNGNESEVHALLLKQSAEVMNLYGDYVTALKYVDEARPILVGTGMNDDLAAAMDVLTAEILVGRGFYRQAIELIDSRLDYYATRSKDEEGKRRIVRERKREYARMILFKADAYRRMGDYLNADKYFVQNTLWIKDNLKKSDILYSENLYYNTLMLEENGMDIEAVVKGYEDADRLIINNYALSHHVSVAIKNRLIKGYVKAGKDAKIREAKEVFRKSIMSEFGKKSIYSLLLATLNYDVLMGGKDKGLEDEVAEILGEESVIPENHRMRIDLLEFASKIAAINGRPDNIGKYINEILNIKEILYGEESPEYQMSMVHLANYYVDYTEKFDEAIDIYNNSWEKVVSKEITEGHLDYVDVLDHIAVYYQENDEYKKASDILDIALEASRRKYDDKDPEYAIELDRIANLQYKIGRYDEAEDNILKAIEILKDSDVEGTQGYLAQTLITEATLLAIKGEYDEAETNMNKSEKIQSKGIQTVKTSGIDIDDELAEVFLDIGRYREAEELIEDDLEKKTRQFGEKSRHLNDPLILKSRVKMILGDYTKAEELADKAYKIMLGIFGDESSKITPAMLTSAKINTFIGDYDIAIEKLEKVVEIREKQFGRDHIDVARALSDLALVQFYNNTPTDQVEETFLRAEKIIGRKLGGSNPYYAEVLKNLAIVYIAEENYNEAFRLLDKAGGIWSAKIGRRNNVNAATINVLKGDIYYNQKNYDEAEKYYGNAKKLYVDIFNDNHPEYVKVLSKLSKTYFMQGDIKHSQDVLEEALANYSVFIKDYFPALSEREKAKFWNTIKSDYEFYNTLVINYNRKNNELIGTLYNNALLTKALLLSSSIKIKQRIISSGDEEMIGLYNDWEAKKELLTYVLSMSSEQMLQAGIDGKKLSEDVENIEKQLSQKSEDFSSGFDQEVVTWKDVQSSLVDDEVALEMIRFRVFNHKFSTDSIMYAVLYVTNEKKSTPGLILLKNGKDLEKKYLKYYRNSIKFRIDDPKSYENFWKPIQDVIGNPGNIYLSADGVYNQINLEAIKVEDGSYVLDNSNIILISNTKDLYLDKQKEYLVQDANTVEMFGDPTYYVKSNPGRWVGRATHRGGNPEVIGNLPGTAVEVNTLKTLFRNDGWVIENHMEKTATEKAIKEMDNPKVFHIATHGFFQPNSDLSSEEIAMNENLAAQNPLLKTGLLMAGAGDILNQTTNNFNMDDGILTAYEGMNLNLDKTDLVVLSACETGLGEIEAGEGVYGLQRAFLVAGARTIIMSLFKVSDEATQKLMVSFYSKWLVSGNKRASFIEAKKEIRDEYKDPIFWGPFIMIGLE
ncbi:CHAT domain-containing protein [Reichenbachiella versicolor]|uniref:CHAT domain-containing protein n=1 Tax=Reichenbachiella versicolor TaxID=1821036 RepID=UPI000D6DC88D|nr:tetratricopeptide repeat protein [Reichenbachiella versicolor]